MARLAPEVEEYPTPLLELLPGWQNMSGGRFPKAFLNENGLGRQCKNSTMGLNPFKNSICNFAFAINKSYHGCYAKTGSEV